MYCLEFIVIFAELKLNSQKTLVSMPSSPDENRQSQCGPLQFLGKGTSGPFPPKFSCFLFYSSLDMLTLFTMNNARISNSRLPLPVKCVTVMPTTVPYTQPPVKRATVMPVTVPRKHPPRQFC